MQFSGIDQETLNIALNPEEAPVVTYVSRNGGKRRMLRSADHDRLVAALEELCGTRGWELNILDAQDLPPEEQLQVFARTTVRFFRRPRPRAGANRAIDPPRRARQRADTHAVHAAHAESDGD